MFGAFVKAHSGVKDHRGPAPPAVPGGWRGTAAAFEDGYRPLDLSKLETNVKLEVIDEMLATVNSDVAPSFALNYCIYIRYVFSDFYIVDETKSQMRAAGIFVP